MIAIKRIYEACEKKDGFRVLVDRLWPRGVSKEEARVDSWLREIAPSDELRKWFSHEPEKWEGFKKKYWDELKTKPELLEGIKQIEKEKSAVTLLYASRDKEHNNAVALVGFLKQRIKVFRPVSQP